MEINYFEMFYLVLGGLGLFLFGMKQLSQSLQVVRFPGYP